MSRTMYVPIMVAALMVGSVKSDAQSLPSFHIPAFDYTSIANGDAPSRLLKALQADGIIALQNIPNYANLRSRYLRKAAECAALTGDESFISRKLFDDGTQRRTISTNAGRELKGSAVSTDAACPGYRKLYEEFSQTMEHAVNTFGRALDETSFKVSDGERTTSSRQLVSDSVRLDHFHLYEADPSEASPTNQRHRKLELSLPLHEDYGLFIAMSAPKFFDLAVDSRELVERHLMEDMSGLIMQTSSRQRVRPVLKEDELVIMMGTGASRWLQTSHYMPAVMHGMKMPEGSDNVEAGTRRLRAWFGKMTLLPAYQRMLYSENAVFETHVNATRRYLLENEHSDLQTVGCASGRQLQASDKCTFRTCTLLPGATTTEPCSTICNREGHGPEDAANCAKSCTCTNGSGAICWMLCVGHLPPSECPIDKQKCTDDQKMVCQGGAPAHPTTAAVPTAAVPTAEVTTDPTEPVTTAPTTPTDEVSSASGTGDNSNEVETTSEGVTGSASESPEFTSSSSSEPNQDDVQIPKPLAKKSSSSVITLTTTLLIVTVVVSWTL